jgi:gag-polypeptide of LTR copia-type
VALFIIVVSLLNFDPLHSKISKKKRSHTTTVLALGIIFRKFLHPDCNAASAWERLKKMYEPVAAPTLVKLEKQFRDHSLKKGQDLKIWITELEDLCVRLETMDFSISENQLMIHILNKLTTDYKLQLAMMERRIGNSERPLTLEDIKRDLSLHFERLNSSSTQDRDSKVLEEYALFSGQFKGKCRNCGIIGHKLFQCKDC